MTGQVGNVRWLEQNRRKHSPVLLGSLKSGPARGTLGVLLGAGPHLQGGEVRCAAGQGHPTKA